MLGEEHQGLARGYVWQTFSITRAITEPFDENAKYTVCACHDVQLTTLAEFHFFPNQRSTSRLRTIYINQEHFVRELIYIILKTLNINIPINCFNFPTRIIVRSCVSPGSIV